MADIVERIEERSPYINVFLVRFLGLLLRAILAGCDHDVAWCAGASSAAIPLLCTHAGFARGCLCICSQHELERWHTMLSLRLRSTKDSAESSADKPRDRADDRADVGDAALAPRARTRPQGRPPGTTTCKPAQDFTVAG
eukprot:1141391-Rhodomonas_salina.1